MADTPKNNKKEQDAIETQPDTVESQLSTEKAGKSQQPEHKSEGEEGLIQDISEHSDEHGELSRAREVFDRAQSGAPAAGKAVRDFFSTDEIFQRLLANADEEIDRSTRLLFFSGLAAGLSIGLSLLARAAVTSLVPDPDMSLAGNLLYPIGFLLIVMGRYQLFTENTLTPVTLVLTRLVSIPALLRVWGIVLLANVLGAALIAFALANTGILSPEAAQVAQSIGQHALEMDVSALFFKGIIAGWLVASMVWLIHAARDSITRFVTVFFIMYLIPTADLFHCIVGACEALYMVFIGQTDLGTATFGFFLPVLIGNTVGGVLLVGLLNYSQTRASDVKEEGSPRRLSWRAWITEYHTIDLQETPTASAPRHP